MSEMLAIAVLLAIYIAITICLTTVLALSFSFIREYFKK